MPGGRSQEGSATKAMEAEEAKKRAKLRKIEKDRKRITALINRARSRRGEPPLPP